MASKCKVENLDAYIIAHYRSMTQAEISRATGASTSQVSRRVIALREAGRLDNERPDFDGEAMPDERLTALDELCELLHRELATAGGQSLARVSSEYRKAMEERENLRAEMGISQDNRYKVGMLTCLIMMRPIFDLVPLHPIPENVAELQERYELVVKATLRYLHDEGAIVVKPDVLKGFDEQEDAE